MATVTVFTPTHNLTHIQDAARSIACQTALTHGLKIEWAIGYNNGLLEQDVRDAIGVLPVGVQVCFPEIDRNSNSIGKLKRQLCLSAKGDVFVELDHDDMLASSCIEDLMSVIRDDTFAFAYSDTAIFEDGTYAPITYSSQYGWRDVPHTADVPNTDIHGRHLLATKSHPPTARSFSQILYAPDHVRAWTRGAYVLAGGHDESLMVCDDHDLLCRTYSRPEIKIAQIPKCLYYYRRGSTSVPNTFAGGMNSYIQSMSGQGTARYPDFAPVPDFAQPIRLRDKYLHGLVLAEGKRLNGTMLDIGGGVGCPSDWTSVDKIGGRISRDVLRGLPFEDSSVFAIRAFDFFEHLSSQDAAWFIGECWRVLRHGGWLITRTPSENGAGGSSDLSHLSTWNTRNWAYFWSKDLKAYRNQAFPGLMADFQPVRVFEEKSTLGPWPCQWEVPYIVADLVALKNGPKLPGRDYI